MTILEKLIQDIDVISSLLDSYFDIICKTISADEPSCLTEAECLTKEGIVLELRAMIHRLSVNIERFSKTVCKSETQRDVENRNLIDFGNGVRNSLNRLERFDTSDTDLKEMAKKLAKKIEKFSIVVDQYIKKSSFKIYSLQKAIELGELEERDVLRKYNL